MSLLYKKITILPSLEMPREKLLLERAVLSACRKTLCCPGEAFSAPFDILLKGVFLL